MASTVWDPMLVNRLPPAFDTVPQVRRKIARRIHGDTLTSWRPLQNRPTYTREENSMPLNFSIRPATANDAYGYISIGTDAYQPGFHESSEAFLAKLRSRELSSRSGRPAERRVTSAPPVSSLAARGDPTSAFPRDNRQVDVRLRTSPCRSGLATTPSAQTPSIQEGSLSSNVFNPRPDPWNEHFDFE